MSLHESIVENAALAIPRARLVRAFPQRERRRSAKPSGGLRQGYGGQVGELVLRSWEVVLVGRLRKAIRGLNLSIPEEARATVRQYRMVHIERMLNS